MPRISRWNAEERSQLLKMVHHGVAEQEIRNHFIYYDKYGVPHAMSAASFAQQLKRAMVESGEIKQGKKQPSSQAYAVTATGRLTINDFSYKTGAKPGQQYVLSPPRGRIKFWRLIPAPVSGPAKV